MAEKKPYDWDRLGVEQELIKSIDRRLENPGLTESEKRMYRLKGWF